MSNHMYRLVILFESVDCPEYYEYVYSGLYSDVASALRSLRRRKARILRLNPGYDTCDCTLDIFIGCKNVFHERHSYIVDFNV